MSKQYDRAAARASIDHLNRLASENGGKVPTWAVQASAAKLGVKERTVWRWLSDGVPEGISASLDSTTEREIMQALAAAHGRRKAAWKAMTAEGKYSKSYEQFTRDIRKLSPIQHATVTEGVKAALTQGLYLKGSSTGRLDRVLFDHTEADIRLQRSFAGELEMFRPWVTFLLDAHTRMIMGWIVTEGDGVRGDPGTESLVALLGSSIHGSVAADGTFIGGVPAVVQFDNAKAHLAAAMINGYLELGIATHAIKPGSPWEDGRVERLMRTFREELLASLPGYTKALPDRYAHEAWTPEQCMGIQEFMVRLQEWVDHYNFERQHSALKMTPFEAWKADPTPITQVDDDLVRQGFLAEQSGRKISKNGVRFKDVDYVHPLLGTKVGKKVAVRYLPNDRSFIDIYIDGQFLCTAVPHSRLGKDERQQIVRERNRQISNSNHLLKRSGARAQRRAAEGNPLVSPERDPNAPARQLEDSDDDDYISRIEKTTRAATTEEQDRDID